MSDAAPAVEDGLWEVTPTLTVTMQIAAPDEDAARQQGEELVKNLFALGALLGLGKEVDVQFEGDEELMTQMRGEIQALVEETS